MPIYRQTYNKLFSRAGFLQGGFARKTKTLSVLFLFLSIPFLKFISVPQVNANLDDSIFIIKATWPADGSTNIPVDLKSGLAGSSYSDPPGIGSIAIGYGTDLSGGCGNPPNCPNIPDIKSDSINPSTITISSPNDPDIAIKYSGKQECYGECYGSDSFYHNFSIIPVNSAYPNGIKLMPQTTYTITIKGGGSGIVAIRSTINGNKDVYLPSDYSWSFTTGDGDTPIRQAPTATPTPIPTNTPSPTPTSNSNQEGNNASSSDNASINPSFSPTISAIQQQKKVASVGDAGITSIPTSEPPNFIEEVAPSPTGIVAGVSSNNHTNRYIAVALIAVGALILSAVLYVSKGYWLKLASWHISQVLKRFHR